MFERLVCKGNIFYRNYANLVKVYGIIFRFFLFFAFHSLFPSFIFYCSFTICHSFIFRVFFLFFHFILLFYVFFVLFFFVLYIRLPTTKTTLFVSILDILFQLRPCSLVSSCYMTSSLNSLCFPRLTSSIGEYLMIM